MRHNIYLIEAKEGVGWNSYNAHVIIADTPKEAREMCPTGDEGMDTWIEVRQSTVKTIGITNRKKEIVLSSFNAG